MRIVLGQRQQMWGLPGTISRWLETTGLLNLQRKERSKWWSIVSHPSLPGKCKYNLQRQLSKSSSVVIIAPLTAFPFPCLWLPYWPQHTITHVPLCHWQLKAWHKVVPGNPKATSTSPNLSTFSSSKIRHSLAEINGSSIHCHIAKVSCDSKMITKVFNCGHSLSVVSV